MEVLKDFPYCVEIYKRELRRCKYIPRLYRSHTREEVRAILSFGLKRTDDMYLKLDARDLGYIYADADRRRDDEEVKVAGWIMDFIEDEKPWNSIRFCP